MLTQGGRADFMVRAGMLIVLAAAFAGLLVLVRTGNDAAEPQARQDQRPTAVAGPVRSGDGPVAVPSAVNPFAPTLAVPDITRYGFARFSTHPLADRVMTGFGVPPAMRLSGKEQAQIPPGPSRVAAPVAAEGLGCAPPAGLGETLRAGLLEDVALGTPNRQIEIGNITWAGLAGLKGQVCEIVLTGKLAIDKALRGEVTVSIVQDEGGRHMTSIDYRFSGLPADTDLIEAPLRARGMVGSEGSEVAGAVAVERERRSLSFQPVRSGVQQQILQDAHWLDARLKRARRSFVLTIEMPLFR